MTWRRLDTPHVDEEMRAAFRMRTRILVDEALGKEVASWLRARRFNTIFGPDVGLGGKSDEDVFAYAWREQRMLWTHDRDFLDDRRFPEHRNPGIVILPGADGDQTAMGTGLAVAVRVFGYGPKTWTKTKTVVSATGEVSMRHRQSDAGSLTTSRYRLIRGGGVEVWED